MKQHDSRNKGTLKRKGDEDLQERKKRKLTPTDDTSYSEEEGNLGQTLNKNSALQLPMSLQTCQNKNYNPTSFNNTLVPGTRKNLSTTELNPNGVPRIQQSNNFIPSNFFPQINLQNIGGNFSQHNPNYAQNSGYQPNPSNPFQSNNFIPNNYFLQINLQNIGGNFSQHNLNYAQNINNNYFGYENNNPIFSTHIPTKNSSNENINKNLDNDNDNNHQKKKGKPLYEVKKTKLPHSDWILEFKEVDQKKLNKLNSFLISDHCPERLRVDFEECFLTEPQMKSIFNSISKNYPLGLTLAIGNESNISEEIFSHLGEIVSLGNYPNGLFLELSGSSISILAFEKILKGLSSEKAGNIRIGLNACEIDDSFIDALGKFLQEGKWKSGTTLDLGFNSGITKEGIQRLIQWINLSKATEKIEIDFSRNEKITNQLLSSINPGKRHLFSIKIDHANDLKKNQQIQTSKLSSQIHQNNRNPSHTSLHHISKNSKKKSSKLNKISDMEEYTLSELHEIIIEYHDQKSVAKALDICVQTLSTKFTKHGLYFKELKRMTVEKAKKKYGDLYGKQLADIKIQKTLQITSLSPLEIYKAFYSWDSVVEAARKLSEMKQEEVIPDSLTKCFNNFFKGLSLSEGQTFPFKMLRSLAKRSDVCDAISNEMINAKLDRPLKKMNNKRKQAFTALFEIYKKYCLNACSQTQDNLSSEKFMENEKNNSNTSSLDDNPSGYYQNYGPHGFFNNSQNNNLQKINTENDQTQTQTDAENDLTEFDDIDINNLDNYFDKFN